ncbi:copper resistance protein CopC [Ktedonospora formicarum]|uniref:Copper resistance protein CopC n=1 Tax=Ktedonospora formicarum TaxID=2778364 RepID=A0A8J3MPB8_9CHLR|nr:copper resistance protein CopC [Ktedonospora formicarum]GHO43662.1 hypothetical protein KSX_18250 [Ktedonospora formicarum]
MRKQRLPIIILAFTLALVIHTGWLLFTPPPVAYAHAFVIGSDPIDGSTITKAPSVAHVYFNAPLSPLSSARIYSIQRGVLVDITEGSSSIASTSSSQLNIPLRDPDQLPEGSYEIKWTAVAATDGQTTNGIIGFDVGLSSLGISGKTVLGPSTSNNLTGTGGSREFTVLSILSTGWNWVVLIALTFWIGLLVSENWTLIKQARIQSLLEHARRRTISLQWLCLSALLIGEIVVFILRVAQMTQAFNGQFTLMPVLDMLTQTTYGILLLIRLALILVAMGLLHWTSRTMLKDYPLTPTPRLVTRTGALGSVTGSLSPITGPLGAVTNATRVSNVTDSITGSFKKVTASQPGKKTSNAGSQKYQTREFENKTNTLTPSQHHYAPIWLILAGLIVLTRSLSSEAAQVLHPHASAILFDWLAQVSLGIWLGGLAYLGLILLPLLNVVEREHYSDSLVVLQRRFAPFQLGSIGALLISGFYLYEASIPTLNLFLADPYGRTLLVLAGLIVLLLLMSWVVLFVLRPKLLRLALFLPVVTSDMPTRRARQSVLVNTGRTLKQVVSIQALLGAGMLLCLSLLTFYAPPIVFPTANYQVKNDQATTQPTTKTQQAGDLSVSLLITPGKLNETNTAILTLKDKDGQPVTNAQVKLTLNMVIMDMGTTQVTLKDSNGVYAAVFDPKQTFTMNGVWAIDVEIIRPKLDPVSTRFQFNIS